MSKYFDRQSLIHKEKELLFTHIDICLSCKKEFNFYNQLYMLLPKYERKTLSAEFNFKILRRIRNINREKFLDIPKYVLNFRRLFVPLGLTLLVIFTTMKIFNTCGMVDRAKSVYELYPAEELDLAMLELIEFIHG
ncbi:MAG: hypothetical protein NZ839_03015 [Endomicrobia bacterium]|nr:hypothetical protein [Endomicrobiia bacterium]